MSGAEQLRVVVGQIARRPAPTKDAGDLTVSLRCYAGRGVATRYAAKRRAVAQRLTRNIGLRWSGLNKHLANNSFSGCIRAACGHMCNTKCALVSR